VLVEGGIRQKTKMEQMQLLTRNQKEFMSRYRNPPNLHSQPSLHSHPSQSSLKKLPV
jgi:hypothetical protein